MNKEYFQRIAGIKPLNESIGGIVSLMPLREMGDIEESFDKDMTDVALAHSNTSPNTPKGAKAGESPKQNEAEYADDADGEWDDDVNPFPSLAGDDDEDEEDGYRDAYDNAADSIKAAIENLRAHDFSDEDIHDLIMSQLDGLNEVDKSSGELDWSV